MASRNARLAARQIKAATDRLEPELARAFAAAVRGIKSEIKLQELSKAIARGDFTAAMDIVGIAAIEARMKGGGLRPGAPTLVDKLVEAFRVGGAAGMRQLPPSIALQASLDLTNPEAVRYLSNNLPSLIREVTDESIQAVQQTLLRGFNEGIAPTKLAREVRGVVGLTDAQAEYVTNFRRQLETGELGGATRPWKRRLSATEQAQARSMFTAGPQSGPKVDAIVARYEQSLINRRAMNISSTEVNRAFGEGQDELWRQAQEQGLIDPMKTTEHWLVTRDERLRKAHRRVPIDNPEGVQLGGLFRTVVGPVRGPRTSGNASFDINCRCSKYLGFNE